MGEVLRKKLTTNTTKKIIIKEVIRMNIAFEQNPYIFARLKFLTQFGHLFLPLVHSLLRKSRDLGNIGERFSSGLQSGRFVLQGRPYFGCFHKQH